MITQHFNRQVREQLPEWEKRGWVNAAAAAEMREAYPVKELPMRLGSLVLSVLGSVLLLLGVIMVLAHNWEELGRPLRAVIAVVPLGSCLGLGCWALLKRPQSVALAESVGVGTSLAFCAAISLVAQTYQIPENFPAFMLTWSVFTLGIALILGSGLSLILFHALAAIWAHNAQGPMLQVLAYSGMLLASLSFFHGRLWGRERPVCCARVRLPIFLAMSVAIFAPFDALSGGAWPMAGALTWLGAVFLIADSPGMPLGRGVRWLSAIGVSGLLLAYSFLDNWMHLDFARGMHWNHSMDAYMAALPWATVWMLILASALVLAVLQRRRDLKWLDGLWVGASGIGLAAWILQPPAVWALTATIAVNLLTLALSLGILLRGLRERDVLRANLGLLLLSALILCRFFDSDLQFLAKGLVFIALGTGFIALNLLLRKLGKQNTPSPLLS